MCVRRLPSLVAAICVAATGSVRGQELTERQLIERLDASPAAQAERLRIEETRAAGRLRTALPNSALTFTQERALGTRDDFLLLRQELPVLGQRRFWVSAADARTRMAEARAAAAIQRFRGEARTAFVQLLVAQQRQDALQRGLDILEGVVTMVRVREREGDSPRFDRLRAERELADVRADALSERIAAAAARGRLVPYFGGATTPSGPVARGDLAAPQLASLETLLGRALDAHPAYRASLTAIEAEMFEERAAARLRWPQSSVTGGLKNTAAAGASGRGYTFGVELRVPAFDNGRRAVTLASTARRRAELESQALRLRIDSDVRAAYQVVELHSTQAEAYEREVSGVGAELARVARVAYEEGELGVLELLDAHRTALAATLRAIEMRGQSRLAMIALDVLAGFEVVP